MAMPLKFYYYNLKRVGTLPLTLIYKIMKLQRLFLTLKAQEVLIRTQVSRSPF